MYTLTFSPFSHSVACTCIHVHSHSYLQSLSHAHVLSYMHKSHSCIHTKLHTPMHNLTCAAYTCTLDHTCTLDRTCTLAHKCTLAHTRAYAHASIYKTRNVFIITCITLLKPSENNSHWVSILAILKYFIDSRLTICRSVKMDYLTLQINAMLFANVLSSNSRDWIFAKLVYCLLFRYWR